MLKTLTSEQFWSLSRTTIQSAGAALVALGTVTPESVEHVIGLAASTQIAVGAIANIATTVYSLWLRRKAGLVASAAALPEVAKIVTTPDMVAKVGDATMTVTSRG